MSVKGAGGNRLVFGGRAYGGVSASRRGQSSLSWPKPKLKFKMPTGVVGGLLGGWPALEMAVLWSAAAAKGGEYSSAACPGPSSQGWQSLDALGAGWAHHWRPS